jgi:hypothetical protein
MQTELEIFVSSSMKEFRAERAMLRDLIPTLNQGVVRLKPWIYEDDAYASDESIQQLYRRYLQESELYIGIFGKKYGEYTIDEFNVATDWGLTRHIYVQVLTEGEEREPELKDFLEKIGTVKGGLAPRWFKDLDDLRRGVTDSIRHWLTNRIMHRSGSAWATLADLPDLLPDLPKKLIGREDLIAEITPLLDQAETMLLQGFGGMGKSALAATIAANRINGRPVLWQKLGTEIPAVIFEAIARPFNAQQRMAAADGDQKPQLVKQLLLRAQVALVVLDDAWDGKSLNAVLKAIPPPSPSW